MARAIDHDALLRALRTELGALGTRSAAQLGQRLQVSQPVVSRLLQRAGAEVLAIGRARHTRYALRRNIAGVDAPITVYAITADGSTQRLAVLHAIAPRGFRVEALGPGVDSDTYDDLPWFLNDVRPSGFMGRQIPALHPDLALPADVNLWSADDVLRYATRYGNDTIGNFIVGDAAFQRHLAAALAEPPSIARAERATAFASRARDALRQPVGSSAGGEQPKFLTTVEGRHVLVKFSPERRDAIAQRVVDLLVCEHLANEVMREHGDTASVSAIVEGEGRVFLEVERFDRVGALGRRGVLSLAAFDHQFVGAGGDWSAIAAGLAERSVLTPALVERIRFRDVFGELIANTDRHARNLSFFVDGTRIVDLTPSYDMLPALYMPTTSGELPNRAFAPKPLSPASAPIAARAVSAAITYWNRVAESPQVSSPFRTIAATNLTLVQRVERTVALLPSASRA